MPVLEIVVFIVDELLGWPLDALLEWLLLVGEVECALKGTVLELEWELTVDLALEETLVAELEGEILLDEDEALTAEDEDDAVLVADEAGCAELDEVA